MAVFDKQQIGGALPQKLAKYGDSQMCLACANTTQEKQSSIRCIGKGAAGFQMLPYGGRINHKLIERGTGLIWRDSEAFHPALQAGGELRFYEPGLEWHLHVCIAAVECLIAEPATASGPMPKPRIKLFARAPVCFKVRTPITMGQWYALFVTDMEVMFAKTMNTDRAIFNFDVVVNVALWALQAPVIGGGELNHVRLFFIRIVVVEGTPNRGHPVHREDFMRVPLANACFYHSNCSFDLLTR
jgi:hypothetical protein